MNTSIIQLTLVLLPGICIGFYVEWPLKMAFLALLCAIGLFLLAYFRARKLLFPDAFFGNSAFLLFFTLGIFISSLHLPQNQPQHYLNRIPPEDIPMLKLFITENLKPDLYSNKFIAEVKSVNDDRSHGKLLLLVPKDSIKTAFLEGDVLLVAARPELIPAPLNPHQFSYSTFMARKDVWRQVNIQEAVFQKLSSGETGLKTEAAMLRKEIISSLKKNNFDQDELAVVQALLLGQKQDISAETYNNFVAAGAIHILAVSGLHVGIILMLLHWLFKPLKRFRKGKVLKTICIIVSLWGFAVLAGLSPSVVRAVTMFSFIAVGLEINRRTSTLNSIFLSLLLLLLIKPQWIFEVGFQLSYLAVLSIVLIQPLLSRLFEPPNRVLNYFWQLLTVSIAAQVGVLPLSLHYFHQFPGLFFLTNLLILPFLGLILILGVLLIFLAVLDILPSFYAKRFENTIELLNRTVEMIARQEQFIFKEISFGTAQVWTWYLLIFSAFLMWKSFGYKKVIAVLTAVVILQAVYLFERAEEKEHLIVFHKSRSSIVGKKQAGKLQLYHELPDPATDLKMLRNFKIGENISRIEEKPSKNVHLQKGNFLIVLDSSGILPDSLPEKTHLLLAGSPRVNLERIITQFAPLAIIADGSNYPSMVQKWKRTALENNIPFYYTRDDGAYVIE